MLFKHSLIFFLFWALSASAYSHSETSLYLNNNLEEYNISREIYASDNIPKDADVFWVKEHKDSFSKNNKAFIHVPAGEKLWFYLDLEKGADDQAEWFVLIPVKLAAKIQYYQFKNESFVNHSGVGKFWKRKGYLVFPVLSADLNTGKAYFTLESSLPLYTTPVLLKKENLNVYLGNESRQEGIVYGIFFFSILIFLFMLGQHRRRIYFFLALAVLIILLWHFSVNISWLPTPSISAAIPFFLENLLTLTLFLIWREKKQLNESPVKIVITAFAVLALIHSVALWWVPPLTNALISSFLSISLSLIFFFWFWRLEKNPLQMLSWLLLFPAFFFFLPAAYPLYDSVTFLIRETLLLLFIFFQLKETMEQGRLYNAPDQESIDRENKKFSPFVPTEFLRLLDRNEVSEIFPGDNTEKEITIMFVDIRQFSSISERLTSAQTVEFLNSYLARMTPIIKGNNGFIDKFIGDAIMAIFPGDGEDAVKAAIDIRIELTLLNAQRTVEGNPAFEIGIGIHSGKMSLGAIGTMDRLETTVIGDNVNIASRVESLTKLFHAPLLITDSVYKQIRDPALYFLREIDSIRVRGKKNPIVIYECFDADRKSEIRQKKKTLSKFSMGLFLYKAGRFQEALDIFTDCSETAPEDPLPKIYGRRCNFLLENPPGDNWSGISRFRDG